MSTTTYIYTYTYAHTYMYVHTRIYIYIIDRLLKTTIIYSHLMALANNNIKVCLIDLSLVGTLTESVQKERAHGAWNK